jgi:hypothetical protein
VKRALVAGLVLVVFLAPPATAQTPARVAIVVIIDGATLPELFAMAPLRALASQGGAALTNGRTGLRTSLIQILDMHEVTPLPLTNHGVDLHRASPSEAVAVLEDFLNRHPQPTLAMVVATSWAP